MPLTKRDQDGQQQAELKETLQKIRPIVSENRRLTVRSIAEQVSVFCGWSFREKSDRAKLFIFAVVR